MAMGTFKPSKPPGREQRTSCATSGMDVEGTSGWLGWALDGCLPILTFDIDIIYIYICMYDYIYIYIHNTLYIYTIIYINVMYTMDILHCF
jgi:hypothetical protein